ncbi:MAG TPA: hypothetical protein VK694_00225 [Verrucomicrobiae bacterium]|nr:hypothetical protein [Verrucomicrobiae bacterium]
MTSTALDVSTIAHALLALEDEFLGTCRWASSGDPAQDWFLRWYHGIRDLGAIKSLTNIEALASTDYNQLNKFLVKKGFDPKFGPLDLGVASVLDMLVEWLTVGERVPFTGADGNSYPAFKLEDGVRVTNVRGLDSPVVTIDTQSGATVFLCMIPEPANGMELVRQAMVAMDPGRKDNYNYDSVVLPTVDLNLEPDMGWMLGINTVSSRTGGQLSVSQAFQQFRFRMNERGARAKVATGIGFECTSVSTPLVFDRPFMCFMVQQGSVVPLAVLYADTDVWLEPAGSLEEL